MSQEVKVILIGGTSHTGKSSAAQRLSSQLGWDLLSTDQLARHPGRPWRDDGSELPADVISHYEELAPDALCEEVRQHYAHNVWPIVLALVECRARNRFDRPLVVEGSAILPSAAEAGLPDVVRALWLSAGEDTLRNRILESSNAAKLPAAGRRLVEAFAARALLFDNMLRAETERQGRACIDVDHEDVDAQLMRQCTAGGV